MAKTMTPSAERKVITDGQIDKAVDVYRSMLRKHREELDSELVQQIICSDDYVNEQVGVLRRRVEAVSGLIFRSAKVNRTWFPQESLFVTRRRQCVNPNVVATMPCGEGEHVVVCFFTLDRRVNDDDLAKEYKLRGLKPDPYAQCIVNEADPDFAYKYPNSTHWQDATGQWCSVTFREGDNDGRCVDVDYHVEKWGKGRWFGGVVI